MALAPGSRYATARALADDLELWLADEPVAAYREPLLARVGRWGRRHRTLTVGLLTAAVIASLGVLAYRWERSKAEQHRRLAASYLLARQALKAAVEEVSGKLDATIGPPPPPAEVGGPGGPSPSPASVPVAAIADLKDDLVRRIREIDQKYDLRFDPRFKARALREAPNPAVGLSGGATGGGGLLEKLGD